MSAVAGAPPITPGMGGETPADKQGMSPARKILYAVAGVWVGGIVLFVILFGVTAHKAPEVVDNVFSPVNEFKLDTWFKLGPIAINKGVLYLLLAGGIIVAGTVGSRHDGLAAALVIFAGYSVAFAVRIARGREAGPS